MNNKIHKTSFGGWKNCFSLRNAGVEMIATADIGPRIIFLGFEGETNLLKLFEGQVGRSGDDSFLFYGGHRLWAAPEDPQLSYIPDNETIEAVLLEEEGILILIRKADESNLEKRLSMRVATIAERKMLVEDSGEVEVSENSTKDNIKEDKLMRVATLGQGHVVSEDIGVGERLQLSHENNVETDKLMRVVKMDKGKDVEREGGQDDDRKSFARPGLEEQLSEPPSMNDESSKHHFQNNKDCDSGVMASFVVRNELINRGQSPITTASWGITSLTPGGTGFMPFDKEISPQKQLQASNQINLWDYTSLANPAYQWKDEWLEIDQSRTKSKQKVGSFNRKAWLAYRLEDLVLVIFVPQLQSEEENYPDLRSNIEIYFDEDMLELETLSAWETINPGESVYHDEVWALIKLNDDPDNETVIRDYVYPLVHGQIK